MRLTKYERIEKLLQQEYITVYSFQHHGALKKLCKRGYLAGDEKFALPYQSGWSFLKNLYNWMQKQMKKRIKNYSGDLPIWAYLEYRPYNMKVKRFFGDGQVLIKARVPVAKCLLSDFDLWEYAMNGIYLANSKKDQKLYYEDKLKPTKKEIEKSWEKIFELVSYKNKAWQIYTLGDSGEKGRYIQICIDRVNLDDIEYIRICDDTDVVIPNKLKHLVI